MHEHEYLKELARLRVNIETELDAIREYVWEKERAIDGLIRALEDQAKRELELYDKHMDEKSCRVHPDAA